MTAYSPENTVRSYLAGEDLTGKIGYAVKISTTGGDPPKSVRLAGDGDAVIGIVLYEAVPQSTAASVAVTTKFRVAGIQTGGTAKCIASAAVGQGVPVSVAADGRIKAAATGEAVIGFAEEAATAANDSFAVRIQPRGADLP